jgi:thiol-disulfide isomerase/thioredoxin
MKKKIPLYLFILAFSGFISTQILWDVFKLSASQSTREDSKTLQFQSLFKELNFKTSDNTEINLKELKTPIVILNFWASWCLPCLKEFPSLVQLQKKFPNKITVIGINGDEQEPLKEIEKISKKYELNFKNVVDDKSIVGDKFFVSSYPYSVVYLNGKVVHVSQKTMDFLDSSFLQLIESGIK